MVTGHHQLQRCCDLGESVDNLSVFIQLGIGCEVTIPSYIMAYTCPVGRSCFEEMPEYEEVA